MMIEDEELRDTFKIASEEHLQKLDDGLLWLEKNPNDQSKIEELLREAHSLKGDAGMLGVKDVATLAHQWEHILGSIKRGETVFSSAISDRLYQGLDAIRLLVKEAITGEASGINTFYALARMMGAENNNNPNTTPEKTTSTNIPISSNSENQTSATPKANQKDKETENEIIPIANINNNVEIPTVTPTLATTDHNGNSEKLKITINAETPKPNNNNQEEIPSNFSPQIPQNIPLPVPSVPEISATRVLQPAAKSNTTITTKPTSNSPHSTVETTQNGGTYRIETIRVETRNLDALMTQTGELTVTQIRIAHRLTEIEEIVSLWEEWSRDTFINRTSLEEIEKGNHNGALLKVQNLYHKSEERLERLGYLVNRLRNAVYEDTARLDIIADELEEGIRTLRLLPLSTIFNLFPRMVRDLAKSQGKQIELIIEGGETRADKRILEDMKDPLMHMIRNAIDHGIETPSEREKMGKPSIATLRLRGYQTGNNVIVEVMDDGRGLDNDKIKQTAIKRGMYREEELAAMSDRQIQSLIFEPGFSTRNFVTEVSGRGVGLDVVRTNVELLKGTLHVESTFGKGCLFRVQLGTTLATAHVLIVAVDGISYALPVEFVQTTRLVSEDSIFTIEGRETILFDDCPISVARLSDLLELHTPNLEINLHKENFPCIILKVGEEKLGIFVDALLDEQDVLLKPQSSLLKRVRNVSGATILGTGEVCMVLNPVDLIKSVRRKTAIRLNNSPSITDNNNDIGAIPVNKKQLILLVEDSIATRTQEKRILEGAGYEVVTAVDGLDGYNKLRTRVFDAVVSDIQMPNLDGLNLTAKIRQHKEYSELPIILVTSLASDEDKKRGAEAGANAYITKAAFNQDILLETLKRLI